MSEVPLGHHRHRRTRCSPSAQRENSLLTNLLVRIHLILEMILVDRLCAIEVRTDGWHPLHPQRKRLVHLVFFLCLLTPLIVLGDPPNPPRRRGVIGRVMRGVMRGVMGGVMRGGMRGEGHREFQIRRVQSPPVEQKRSGDVTGNAATPAPESAVRQKMRFTFILSNPEPSPIKPGTVPCQTQNRPLLNPEPSPVEPGTDPY